MAYTFKDLVFDVLPRVGGAEKDTGITIKGACNSIVSLLQKNMLARKSDLAVTGKLALLLPAYGFKGSLPINFLSFVERPRVEEVIGQFAYAGTMTGTITGYDPSDRTLMVDVTSLSNTASAAANAVQVVIKDEIAVRQPELYPAAPPQWVIVQTGTDALPPIVIATSLKSPLIYSLGLKVLQVEPMVATGTTQITEENPTVYVGQTVTLLPVPGDENPSTPRTYLDPSYFDSVGEYSDDEWDSSSDTPQSRPRQYKVIGSEIWFRPKATTDFVVRGKYLAKAPIIANSQDIIPWNGMFDEVFREGIVWIIKNGVSIPDADKGFMIFFNREFDTIMNMRISLVPETGRVKRNNYL